MFGFIRKFWMESAVLSSLVSTTILNCKKWRWMQLLHIVHCVIFNILYNYGIYLAYYKYMNCNKENVSKYDYVYQTPNYLI